LLVGLFFGERAAFLRAGGDAFIALLQITVLPYVVVAPGFTHQLRRLLIDDRAGCFPLGATGDERHDRGFGGMLHGA
jgi:hypothetical protein